jgi:hypothetical protein
MAYGFPLIRKIGEWLDAGVFPPMVGGTVVDLGSQMIDYGTPHEDVAGLIKRFRPRFDTAELAENFPAKPPYYYAYAAEIWRLCGVAYFSYDVTETAPDCRIFDLNFHEVPETDRGCASLVTNIGTTEHVANQLNAFQVIHDLLKVGGVVIHQVPFTGLLNHCFFNYHPKFFVALIVNNRYKLRRIAYNGPFMHAHFGEGNTIFDGDYLPEPGNWAATALPSGSVELVIEKRFSDAFVPPVDFAKGYFDPTSPSTDLRRLLERDDVAESAWANAFRRGVTPTQKPNA